MQLPLISKYFPELPEAAFKQLELLAGLYPEWNSRVNLISRADIGHLEERHMLHSLSIAKFMKFRPGTAVMDIGTGGGFPGLPLAVLFPESSFTLVDSIGKKIRIVSELIAAAGITNATAICERAEKVQGSFDYAVSRATAPLSDLFKWSQAKISRVQKNAVPNGIICLKGGDLAGELMPFKGRTEVVRLSSYFTEDFFLTKQLIFLPVG